MSHHRFDPRKGLTYDGPGWEGASKKQLRRWLNAAIEQGADANTRANLAERRLAAEQLRTTPATRLLILDGLEAASDAEWESTPCGIRWAWREGA